MFSKLMPHLWLTAIILCAVYLSACTPKAGTTNESPTPNLSAVNKLTPLPLQTPSPGLAVVGGELVDVSTQKGPEEGILFLGEIANMNNGKPVVQLDRGTAPYAIPAANGDFIFQNVKPGKYGLVYYVPELNFLIDNPKGSGSLIFDVSSDQVIDLGKIEITLK